MIWFDTPLKVMSAERAGRLEKLVHELQPDCLVNGRLGAAARATTTPSGDNAIPDLSRAGAWETPATHQRHLGLQEGRPQLEERPETWSSSSWTSSARAATTCSTSAPTAEGVIPQPSQDMLREVGRWLKVNGEAIYGAGRTPVRRGVRRLQQDARRTAAANRCSNRATTGAARPSRAGSTCTCSAGRPASSNWPASRAMWPAPICSPTRSVRRSQSRRPARASPSCCPRTRPMPSRRFCAWNSTQMQRQGK